MTTFICWGLCFPVTSESSSVSFDIVLDRGVAAAEKAAMTLLSLLGLSSYGSGTSVHTRSAIVKKEDAPLIMSAVHRAIRKHICKAPPAYTIKEYPVKV